MKKLIFLLSVVLGCAGLSGVSEPASAGEPQIDTEGKYFAMSGGALEIRGEGQPTFACEGVDAQGQFTTKSTGEISMEFTGCYIFALGTKYTCRSVGALVNSTIAFGASQFHLVYLTDSKTKPGILITPPSGGVFAEISCIMGVTEYVGTGLMGELALPACGKSTKSASLSFTSTGATQEYEKITGTVPTFHELLTGATPGIYGLRYRFSSGKEGSVSISMQAGMSFVENFTLTCV